MDADSYRHVIQACFPRFSVHTISFLAEGWGSSAWEVNGDYVFRFPKYTEINPGLLKEIGVLPALAEGLPLRVPHFEFVWRGGSAYDGLFVGYRKIPGIPLTPAHLSAPVVRGLASQLAEFLTALHRFPRRRLAGLGIPDASADDWRRRYTALYESVRARILPLLEPHKRRNLAAIWERFLRDDANFCFTPVLLHADLSSEHILFDAEHACITGIVDWEDITVGDPALDFTGLLCDYGRGFAARVLTAYQGPADAAILSRARFYGAIASCHEVLFGLDFGLEQHVTHALDNLRAL
ncbi:MAG: hypothetical protein AMJ93_13930 [Anaerolineae bacterium SM23_84]|nr:MAG: hypothetical protein AMJ93_13930 [Anaerolineae bacterium SM23_84]